MSDTKKLEKRRVLEAHIPKKEKFILILQELTSLGDIEGAAIITKNGLLIASVLPKNIEGELLAAMSAAMQGAAESAIQELKKSFPERIIVESENTKLVIMDASKQAILVCIVKPDAQLGLVLIKMSKSSFKIKNEVKNI